MAKKTLTAAQEANAKALYEEFWAKHPHEPNPSDINTRAKAEFLFMKGFENISLMQNARKQAYRFTRR